GMKAADDGKVVRFRPAKLDQAWRERTVEVKPIGHACYNSPPAAQRHGGRMGMEKAKDAKPSALEHSARSHFDELDALMERMLALPIDPAAGEPTTADRTVFSEFQFDSAESRATPQGGGSDATEHHPTPTFAHQGAGSNVVESTDRAVA